LWSGLVAAVIATLFSVSPALASTTGTAPLSGTALHRLLVAPPPPFEPLPDSALKTGLMEFGNPRSGKIGTVVAIAQLKKAKFQRGWETVFRTSDGAGVVVDVFECARPSGAAMLARSANEHVPTTYTSTPIEGVAGVSARSGVSPQGNSVSAAAYSQGRFFVFQDVGGPKDAHDYLGVLTDLAQRQSAAIRSL
jgi:hypothetical protein